MKYTTDKNYCKIFAGKKVIARAYIGYHGYSVRILQGMDRTETIAKICKDCPVFAKEYGLTENYYPYLFAK